MTRKEALKRLADDFGFESINAMLETAFLDSVSPGICVTCSHTTEIEPDSNHGYCEGCGGNTVRSALTLAGVI